MATGLISAVAALMLLLQPSTAAVADAPADVEGVIVVARPLARSQDAIAEFISGVSIETGNGRLGRWDRKICPSVVGMQPRYAQALIDRLAVVAFSVGLEVGEPGCKSNMLIVATKGSDALVAEMIARNADGFGKYDGNLSRGRKALEDFAVSPAAVRWWHVTARVTADGVRYQRGDQVRVRDMGRTRSTTREDFNQVIIVIDAERAGVLGFRALSDYVAMVALAQIDPDADTAGVQSILGLFADRAAGVPPAEGLTDWDMAYLRGLYAAPRDARNGAVQEREIGRSMSGELGTATAPDPDAE